MLSLIWVGICIAVMGTLIIIVRVLGKKAGLDLGLDGIFVLPTWPKHAKSIIGLSSTVFGILPTCILIVCLIVGLIIAPLEEWSADVGMEYMISQALGLMNPITGVGPVRVHGQLISMLCNCFTFVTVTCVMGLVSNMQLITMLSDKVPESFRGLLATLYVGMPLFLIIMSWTVGGIMAVVEGWSWYDGFLYMMSSALGLSTPLTSVAPVSAVSNLIECICIAVELAVAGAILGITGSHPVMLRLQVFIEGKEEEQEKLQRQEEHVKTAIGDDEKFDNLQYPSAHAPPVGAPASDRYMPNPGSVEAEMFGATTE